MNRGEEGERRRREVESYLRGKERGFLATVGRKSNRPTIIPVCFAYYESGKVIYSAVDRKPKSEQRRLARVSNIERNPSVAFIVDTYSDDWRRLSYLLVHATASLVKDPKEVRRAREALISKYPQYRWLGLDGSSIIIIRLKIEGLKLWRFQR